LRKQKSFSTGNQTAMTPKEELIEAIQRSANPPIQSLNPKEKAAQSKRLQRRNGVLVIETGSAIEVDINAFIHDLREERIQDKIKPINPLIQQST
jgi:hypothetical protein